LIEDFYTEDVISLSGRDWRMNYFRPAVYVPQGVTSISRIGMPDGESAGAHLGGYNDSGWWKGSVPSDVRSVLMENAQMEDPFYARNSDKCRWVEEYEWWFRKSFTLPAEWSGRRVCLRFLGVDLYATYWLNGVKLGQSQDMFVPVEFDITEAALFNGKPNTLSVRLDPPPASDSNHYRNGDRPRRTLYHKCQHSWGWDWSRELVSIGIWDSVEVYSYQDACISDLFVQAVPVDGAKSAKVDVELSLSAPADVEGCRARVKIESQDGIAVLDEHEISVVSGSRALHLYYNIENPNLWWPNGYGKQPLYRCSVELIKQDKVLSKKSTTFGIRKLEMLYNPNSPSDAYPLTFSVNNRRIFAQGANWVPADMLFGRIDENLYSRLLTQARDMGFNMLRIWGGGLIEKDSFYNLCDRMGIMVWQEFPLACASYPRDSKFVAEKEKEAEAVIKKLRNHPCISLYCGGNELFYYGESSDSPVLQTFAKVVERLHPAVDYHFSSPDAEREGERPHGPWSAQGENHTYWNNHLRLFASEVGCNSLPDIKTVQQSIPDAEEWPEGSSYRHHFMPAKPESPEMRYGKAIFGKDSLEDEIFYSQLVQADTLRYIMGHYKSNSWKSSGVLFWQYNTSWPEGGWCIVDYYGRPKLACSFLKEACQPLSIHVKDKDWELKGRKVFDAEIFLINHSASAVPASELSIRLYTESGAERTVTLSCNAVEADGISKPLALAESLSSLPGDVISLDVSWIQNGKILAATHRWYASNTWKGLTSRAEEFLRGDVQKFYG